MLDSDETVQKSSARVVNPLSPMVAWGTALKIAAKGKTMANKAMGGPQTANVKTENAVLASVRETVCNLPPERRAEIFADFEGAVKSGEIGYLADTIANWVLGGQGYEYAGMAVNHIEPVVPVDADEQTLNIWNSFWPRDDE